MAVEGIQMKREELTNTFMMISNLKKMVYIAIFQRCNKDLMLNQWFGLAVYKHYN